MVGILGAQHKLQVYITVKVTIHGAFEANVREFTWTASVARNIIELLVAFDFDPSTCSQGSPHRRVANRHTEVLFALLRHKGLIKWFRFGCFGARVSLVILDFIWFIVNAVVIAIKTLINTSIVVTQMHHLVLVIVVLIEVVISR